ncbi:MAG TPA: aroma-sacti cluster domain-containing protein [Ktedonobacteraceae bacterium]|nr:aroma-sacti cluster domain-containing protein [Ktedonobacteraceae bacterium]
MADNQFDPIKQLESVGMNTDTMNDEQRQIISSLSPEEVEVLVNTKRRLDEASDVQGYARGNGNFYY